jgi:Mg-chelatase subunit ChlD
MATPQSVDIIFVLDASGSMGVLGREPVDALNGFIEEQQKLKDGAKFTLYTFNNKTSVVINDVPLAEVKKLEYNDFNPNGMTALYDAMGTAITTKRNSVNNKNVIMVILTDGEENSSQEYKREQVCALTKEMKEQNGWEFIYLGANQDAFKVGDSIGVAKCMNFSTRSGGMTQACTTTASACSSYRSSKATTNVSSGSSGGASKVQLTL